MRHRFVFPFFLGVFLIVLCGCGDRSMKPNKPRNVQGVNSYSRMFNDKNDLHLKAAKAIGIPKIKNRKEAEGLKKKLTKIGSNKWYRVDPLTHSIPYLVPGAAELLEDIGRNFMDSLANKGLNPNRIIVTSVLRTEEDVRRLRRTNINASANSVHCYGTTFDISWKRYDYIKKVDGRPQEKVSEATLKKVLAEVLHDLKKAGRCYVKHEKQQACFHITSRK